MASKATALPLLMATVLGGAGGCSTDSRVLPYEPEVVEVAGTLETEIRFGPPNYGESPANDQRLTIYVLSLEEPIDVGTPESLSEANDAQVADVSRIQLIIPPGYCTMEALIGSPARLRGTLFKRVSSRHFYPVLLSVEQKHSCSAPNTQISPVFETREISTAATRPALLPVALPDSAF